MTHRALVAVLAVVTLLAAGCANHCPEVAAVTRALLERTAIAPGPHAEVRIPLARANALLAELVRDPPLAVPIELPGLGPLPLAPHALTATAREVRLQPAGDDRLRFALRIELADAGQPITTLALETEVTPRLVRDHDETALVTGFGPENLVAVRPVLDTGAERALGDAIARWLPPAIRDHLPAGVLDRAAGVLATHLTGEAYRLLQATLLRQLGELTQVRIRLPALPIAKVALHSPRVPGRADALVIDLTTDLPVRRGLAPAGAPASDDLEVRLSASTAAELANWAIDHGQLPAHYTRGLAPRPDGELRPRFDYLAGDRVRPLKIHVLQDRGGCSYFQVGLRPVIEIAGDQLVVETHDQLVETAIASPVVELALWLKQLVVGAVDESRKAAAHTQLTIGGHTFATRAVRATITGDELQLALQLAAVPPPQATQPTIR